MINKPKKTIKRIIKAIGQRQSVLLIGDWQKDLIKGIQENQNSITQELKIEDSKLEDNSFTRIVADYSLIDGRGLSRQTPTLPNITFFYKEFRRLLLPTGILIISANCEEGIFEKILRVFKRAYIKEEDIKKIKPKVLQDQIHDNGFLIDGYYGYPGGHLLMMAQIQKKEVSTLFSSNKQETLQT